MSAGLSWLKKDKSFKGRFEQTMSPPKRSIARSIALLSWYFCTIFGNSVTQIDPYNILNDVKMFAGLSWLKKDKSFKGRFEPTKSPSKRSIAWSIGSLSWYFW